MTAPVTSSVGSGALIGGRWQPGAGDEATSIDPHHGDVVWRATMSSPSQAALAVEAAAAAFPAWRRQAVDERVAVVRRFAALVAERRDQLATLIARETGKPLWDAGGELAALAGKADVSVAAYHERTGHKVAEMGATRVETTHRAHGPVAVIGPFNFPALLPGSHIIPALVAGNTVVFKPSELAPAVAEAVAALWLEAGVPDGVLNLVNGPPPIVDALIDHGDVRGVFFTGGVPAGRSILRRLADRPDVIAAVELGGNNPLVVWGVDDVEAAARVVVHSAFVSAGQRCLCARRLVVARGASGDAVVDAVLDLARGVRVGDPLGQPQPFIGPLVTAAAASRVITARDALVAAGARELLATSNVEGLSSAHLTPGVLDVDGVANRVDEEIFGPVLQVVRVNTFADAIREANATRFGLVTSILSDDADVVDAFRSESTAGMVNVNVPTVAASGLAPFGGTGMSGNHRPSGFYAADYCAHPVSTLSQSTIGDPGTIHGVDDAPPRGTRREETS